MVKSKLVFICKSCGHESPKWMGQCPGCFEWNSFEEKVKKQTKNGKRIAKSESASLVNVNEIEYSSDQRVMTGIGELDNVLGGGLVEGSLVLFGGDPGIGKSTLILQLSGRLSASGKKVLYISGEESASQIKMRANRLTIKGEHILLKCETLFSLIEESIENEKPDFLIIDSIQTVYCEELDSLAGSVSQVKEITARLLNIAKNKKITTIIIGHVTKEGSIAGPRVLEHMVDSVLYFEGESSLSYRVLRAVKNRFGSTNEIGVFEMTSHGLVEVKNPSKYMLTGKPVGKSGSVVTCALEGTRPILVEVQGLVSKTNYGMARRSANGTDNSRVNLLVAVMEKQLHINMSEYDSYINIAGGLKVAEPSLDLAIITALYSSCKDLVVDDSILIIGEVGLTGEVRAVTQFEKRVKEAKKLGFQKVIAPAVNVKEIKKIKGIEVVGVSELKEHLKEL